MNKRQLVAVIGLSIAFYTLNNWLFPSKKITEENKQVITEQIPQTPVANNEKLYMLENQQGQFVFSTKGGALSEINLAFYSEENPTSLIKPVNADKKLLEQSKENELFPRQAAFVFGSKGTLEKKEPQEGGFYPLIRRTLTSNSAPQILPNYYTSVVAYVDGRGADTTYSVKKISKNSITLEGNLDGKTITKTYTLIPDAPYCFDLSIQVSGDTTGLVLYSGLPEAEVSSSSQPLIKYLTKQNKTVSTQKVSLPKETTFLSSPTPNWVSNSNGYFGIIINPYNNAKKGVYTSKIEGTDVPTRLSLIDEKYKLYPAKNYPAYLTAVPLSFENGLAKVRFFTGPYEDDLLKSLDKTFAKTEENPHYTKAMSFHGWFTFISEPFSKVLYWLMQLFYFFTRSWGVSIILLTVALRVMLYPLNTWSIKVSSKMSEISPEVQKIQERYKKDPQRARMEIVALYKQKKVNPLSGCLPLLIQLPFLIGMFDLLKSVFDLRGDVFIPGWINDLTAPDVVFSWNYPIPFIGTSFHLLPVLLGVAMFFQQRMNLPKDASLMTDQQRQQKATGTIMTLVFTFMFYNFPSGLNVYWLSSMLLGILQQWYTNKNKHRPKIEIIK